MYFFATRSIALLLLGAAVLKLFGLFANPLSDPGAIPPWIQAVVVFFEIGLAFWLLSGSLPTAAWAVSVGAFLLFALVNLRTIWIGHSSCGYFGPVPVSPWYVLGLDLVVLLVLALVRFNAQTAPPQRFPSYPASRGKQSALAFPLCLRSAGDYCLRAVWVV